MHTLDFGFFDDKYDETKQSLIELPTNLDIDTFGCSIRIILFILIKQSQYRTLKIV